MSIATATPVKSFQFVVEIDGVDQFEIQKCTPPELALDSAEHGAGNYTVKTAGLLKAGTAKFEKLRLASTGAQWAMNWLRNVVNTETGLVGLAANYKRVIIFKEIAGGVVISRQRWEGVYPTKITPSDRDRMSSDNAIETIELSVDKVVSL